MTEPPKIRYEIALAPHRGHGEPLGFVTRNVVAGDRDALARLMLDAYMGTIDYEGETLSEAIEEVDSWLAGTPMLDHSYGGLVDGRLVSAVLLMVVDGAPLVRSVMTDPDHKGHRFAGAVTHAALESLRAAGSPFVALYITEGNTPSERLFASLGAVVATSE